MTHDTKTVAMLDDIRSLTYDVVERIAYGGQRFQLSDLALQKIQAARNAYEEAIAVSKVYAYGHNTDPGNRAKVLKTQKDIECKRTLGEFTVLQAGAVEGRLPDRVVRLALVHRLANTLAGVGRLSPQTARAVVDLQDTLPPVPSKGLWSSGEVMACSWLLAPLKDLPILPGEGMALINGSPFGSSFSFDAARTSRRRLNICLRTLAFSFEKALAPLQHLDGRLAELWPVPEYQQVLAQFANLLEGGTPASQRLHHQAPTCFRVIGNHTAVALEAVTALEKTALINMHALKDNPTLVPESYDILSSAGYHDNFSARKIEHVNMAFADLVSIISKQVNHFLAGSAFHRPLYFGQGRATGVEWLGWTLNDAVRSANEAACPTTLALGEDPGGNQSDIVSPVFAAYFKHQQVMRALDQAMAALLTVACLSGSETKASLQDEAKQPAGLRGLSTWLACQLGDHLSSNEPAYLAGAPLRSLIANLGTMAIGENAEASVHYDSVVDMLAVPAREAVSTETNGSAVNSHSHSSIHHAHTQSYPAR